MFEYLITRPMGFIIEHIYNLVSNYGLAIIIFTILIKLILIPLNIHSQKAMKKQQKIQPLMAELQKKYANDQEKLQREMMKIYKENNISMTGGCLPMLIQMPILIGLYQVIQKPLSYLAGVDWANASVINEVIRLKDAMVNLGYNIGNLANATMEQLANCSQAVPLVILLMLQWNSLRTIRKSSFQSGQVLSEHRERLLKVFRAEFTLGY